MSRVLLPACSIVTRAVSITDAVRTHGYCSQPASESLMSRPECLLLLCSIDHVACACCNRAWCQISYPILDLIQEGTQGCMDLTLGEDMYRKNEKKRKDYAFRRQFNEKPSNIPGCPGRKNELA